MFDRAKYIMLDQWGYASDALIIFPASMSHVNTASNFGGKDNVLSAGFITIDIDGKPKCYGESRSLGVKSRPEDTTIAQFLLKE